MIIQRNSTKPNSTLSDTFKEYLGGMYKPRGQMRGEGGCSDDHNTK